MHLFFFLELKGIFALPAAFLDDALGNGFRNAAGFPKSLQIYTSDFYCVSVDSP